MKRKALIVVVLLLLFGCTNGTDKNIKKEKNEEFLYFLYATPLADHPIWLQSKEGFVQACNELKVKCDWIGPKVIDTEKMEEVISQGLIEKVDGIITQGVIKKALLEEAAALDIPIVLVDSNIEDGKKFTFYGKNFQRQAQLLLNEIEKKIPKHKPLVIAIQVAELNFKIAQDQIQEIREVFKNHPGGYEIVAITESKSDKIRAQAQWMNTLRNHPDINVTINFAAESADACAEIAQTLNIKKQLHIYGVDDMDSTIDYIKKGYIDASVVTSFYEYGYKTVYQMYAYKKTGKKPTSLNNEVKLLIVNQDNVDTYQSELKE